MTKQASAGGSELSEIMALRLTVEAQAVRIAQLEGGSNGSPRQHVISTDAYRSTDVDRDILFSAVEKTSMPMIVTDPNQDDDPIVFVNRAFQELCGYGAAELIGRNCRFLQGEATDPADVQRIRNGLKEERDVTVDLLNYRKDGTPFVNELYISPIFDRAGRLVYHFGSQVDVTQARRNVERLAASERRQRAVFQSAVDFAFIVTDLRGVVVDWNRGAERILGWSADQMVGQALDRVFTPEDLAIGRPETEMQLAIKEGSAPDERWHMRRDGSRFWASGKLMPLVSDEGDHTGYVKVLHDRTEQYVQGLQLEEIQAELAASERKWRGLFKDLQEGFILGRVIRSPSGRIVDWLYEEVNQAWGDLVGIDARTAAGRTIRDLFPGIEDIWVNEFADVVESGEAIRFTRQVGNLGRWYDGVCQPAGGDRFTVIFLEVTNRMANERRQTALLELGDRLRDARTVDDITMAAAQCLAGGMLVDRVGFGSVDEATEMVDIPADWRRPGIVSVAGRHSFRSFGSFFDDLKRGVTVAIEDVAADPTTQNRREAFDAIQLRALLNLPIMEHGHLVLVVFAHAVQPHHWTRDELQFVRQVGDRAQAAIARIRAEETQSVLNGELSHRLKNSFAMVQAIASQTLKSVTDRDAVEALNQRLRALSHAHDVLMRQSWSAARFRDVAKAVLHVFEVGDRFVLKGRDIEIGSRATLSLSLLLHELATNALKYGALSVPEGYVDIEWDVRQENGEETFRLVWRERGGPAPVPPTGRGFGSRIIRMGLIGTGGVDLSYEPAGFQAVMSASLPQMQQA